jgi:hypothetical protein
MGAARIACNDAIEFGFARTLQPCRAMTAVAGMVQAFPRFLPELRLRIKIERALKGSLMLFRALSLSCLTLWKFSTTGLKQSFIRVAQRIGIYY